jgi:hypothetical protein
VAKNRYGPPGRSVDLDIHYLMDGERSMVTHRFAQEHPVELPTAPGPVRGHLPAPPAHGPAPELVPGRPRLVVV